MNNLTEMHGEVYVLIIIDFGNFNKNWFEKDEIYPDFKYPRICGCSVSKDFL